MNSENVLVTDGNQRAALAVTRSLGSNGITVITADVMARTLSGASKYCLLSEVYSDHGQVEAFIRSLRRIIEKHDIGVILPITEITMFVLLQYREQFSDVVIPFDSYEKVSLLSDKAALVDLCRKLQIPCPESVCVESGIDALDRNIDFSYPVVLKPYKSRIFSEGKWVSTSVKYAESISELEGLCKHDPVFSAYPFIIQEYIEGYGQGVFLLFNHGRPVASFCHKRLREKPPSGGVSVLCESVDMPPEMERMSIRLLQEVEWHGVAMVEFKVNDTSGPYIMEINTRFWGSLQLAVDAGVDFPYMLYQIAVGEFPASMAKTYHSGVRLRWLLGDFDRLYLLLRSSKYSFRHKLREVASFFVLCGKGLHYEVNRFGDMRPFIEEVRQYFAEVFRRAEKQ